MWKLTSGQNNKRIYTNSETNSLCMQSMVYIDKDGNNWWEFDSLTSIPYTRNFAATKISSLYALGLSKDDLTGHINGLKKILKSDDREKYEKAFALVLDFESKAMNATDGLRQQSALVPVYYTLNDEPIDSFDQSLQLKKMELLEADVNMHSFFLKRHFDASQLLMNSLNSILPIAFQQQNGQSEAIQ